MHSSVSTRVRRGDRGATLVEFGLICPLLFSLLMGIIDFGMVLNDQSEIRQVTRSVARDITIDHVDTGHSCTNYVPGTASNSSLAIVCQVRKELGGNGTTSRVKVLFPDGSGQKRFDRVVVCAQQPMTSLSGLFSSMVKNKTLVSSVSMRIESQPDAGHAAASVEETPLSGSDWTWCS